MTYLGDANFVRRFLLSVGGFLRRKAKVTAAPAPLWVIGHRGAGRYAPENTLAAFRKALDLGANAIETDVCVTRDARFVLWHDATPADSVALVRQLGAEGDFLYLPTLPMVGSGERRAIRDCETALFLERYGYVLASEGLANPLRASRAPEVAPALLEELLEWAPGEARLEHVFLDTKLVADQVDMAVRLLALLAERAERPDHRTGLTYHFLSTQREIVSALVAEAARRPLPENVRITGDFELPGVLRGAHRLGLTHAAMGLGRRTWGDFRYELGRVVRGRTSGRVASIVAWTVNEEDRLRDLAALGVDGIVTDDPALLREIVGRP